MTTHRWYFKLAAFVMLIAMITGGCSPAATPTEAPPPTEAPAPTEAPPPTEAPAPAAAEHNPDSIVR